MFDKRLDGRSKKFKETVNTLENLRRHREDFNLSLRKENIFNQFMNNRLKRKTESGNSENVNGDTNFNPINVINLDGINCFQNYFGISVDDVKIPQESLLQYEQMDKFNQILTIKQWFSINDSREEYSYKRFAVFQLRKFFQKFPKELKSNLMEDELVRIIMRDIVFEKESRIQFEDSYLLTQISFRASKSITKILMDADFIKDLMQLSYIDCIPLIENILIIIGNLVYEDKTYILENTNYLIRLKEILAEDHYTISGEVLSSNSTVTLPILLLWNFYLIIDGLTDNDILIFLDFVPHLVKFFDRENLKGVKQRDKHQEEVTQLLKVIYQLSNFDIMIKCLLSNNILDHMVYLLQFININYYPNNLNFNKEDLIVLSGENLFQCIVIINNIFTLEEQVLFPSNSYSSLLTIFEHLLHRYRLNVHLDIPLIKEIIWCLSNMAVTTTEQLDAICFSQIPQNLLDSFMKNETALEQTLIFFTNAFQNASDQAIVQILKLNFLQHLCNVFKSFNKNEIVISCLSIIKQIFIFCKKIQSGLNQVGMSNVIITELEKHSLITRLEQLSIHNNEAISEYAGGLLNVFEGMIEEMYINIK